MLKKLAVLTNISTKNYIKNLNIYNKAERKINKKSMLFWIIILLSVTVLYLSNEILKELNNVGNISIFLNVYMLFVFTIMVLQAILISTNVFFYSKDIDNLISLPIKSNEILLTKFNTILSILYVTELFILLPPLILYGTKIHVGFGYYFNLLPVLILFPIFIVIVVGIINLVIMKFVKVIKNENTLQFMITMFFITGIFLLEYLFIKSQVGRELSVEALMEGINNIAIIVNKSILTINPIIEIIQLNNIIQNYIYIIFVYILGFLVFLWLGKKYYLNILLSRRYYAKKKKEKRINRETAYREKGINKVYILNEFKFLKRNIIFFLQAIFPAITLTLCLSIITIIFKQKIINNNQEIYDFFNTLSLNIEGFCAMLILLQVLFSFVKYSAIGISKEGRNAIFLKYIPVDLYKQFCFKNIVQIVTNVIISIITLCTIKYIIPRIEIYYLIIIFIDAIIINIINSFIMMIIDLKRPNLNWKTEYEVIKQNENIMFQYALTVIFTLIYLYLSKIFKGINFNISILGISAILMLLLILINRYVKKRKYKLFEKIY